jgi:hypothetical protein
MRVPKTGERVYVDELSRIFVVARVYHETQTADLMPVGSGLLREDVPWRKLFRCWSPTLEKQTQVPVRTIDVHQIIMK